MIISHQYKFIFLKTTKTAGTSVEIALSQHCGPDDVISRIAEDDERVRADLGFRTAQNDVIPFSRYRLRDWARLLRSFRRPRFRTHSRAAEVRAWVGERIWNEYFVFCFERNPFDKAMSRYFWSRASEQQPVSEFLRGAPPKSLTNWRIYAMADEVAVDFVGRYEKLNEDLQFVWQHLKLPGAPMLPRAKGGHRTDRRHYSECLDAESRALIERICAREIAYFGYRFETSAKREEESAIR